MVIHGAIDGFSRVITFLKCSNNNTSSTVLESFVDATRQYGIPSRLRTDRGGEKVLMWSFMEEHRGSNRHSYIAGQSVHNSRIERLWRDVYSSVTSLYVRVFTELEESGALSPANDTDVYALHYVFLPRINASLQDFMNGWNNHPLSTENGLTPLQLYTAYAQGSSLFEDEHVDPTTYGRDPNSEVPDDDVRNETVVVPVVDIPISTSSAQSLRQNIDPLQQCDDFGKQLYLDTVTLLYDLMVNDGLC